jgi:Adenosylmethionine decarboxylase
MMCTLTRSWGRLYDEAPSAAAAAAVAEEETLSSPASTSTTLSQQQDTTHNIGLRQLTRRQLDQICARARCTMLSPLLQQVPGRLHFVRIFSLYVPIHDRAQKTCGTTTLLRCTVLSILIEFGTGNRLGGLFARISFFHSYHQELQNRY